MEPGVPANLNFDHFLRRMRLPASADLVRAIKRFIVSFSFHTTNGENDSRKLQDFLTVMETTIRDHPLWALSTDEEIDSALEGLEKYIMTKLFNRTFASSQQEANLDREISEKICLLQHFIKPDHLDVPEVFRNEASMLFAAKELQKINAFKAPREKLLCVMNCCRVINNLLLNLSMSTNHIPAGADDFLPSLIYVIIKANPPQLHSNAKYIQLFRRQSKLVSEVEYYLTNLISAKSFIRDLSASSLSMEESEFQKHMQSARSIAEGAVTGVEVSGSSEEIVPALRNSTKEVSSSCEEIVSALTSSVKEIYKEGDEYPFMEAEIEDLAPDDIPILLDLYKQVVTRYRMLLKPMSPLDVGADLHGSSRSTHQQHPENTSFQKKDKTLK